MKQIITELLVLVALISFVMWGISAYAYSDFLESCGKYHEYPIKLPGGNGGGGELNLEIDPDAKAVLDIFAPKCATCHNPAAPQGPFVDITDVDEMMLKGIIDPVDPLNSNLYKSLVRPASWMPLGGTKLSVEERGLIVLWMGKNNPNPPPPLKDVDPPLGLPVISYLEEVSCIFRDLLVNVNEADRVFTRYLTLSNYSNLNKQDEFVQLQEAVNKLLNSVSDQARITQAGPADKYGIVYRFDLRDFGLNANDFDNTIVANGQYPYALKRFDQDEGQFFEDAINDFTATEAIAFIRADWFIFNVSQPPIYYDLLDIPVKKNDLLADLGVVDIEDQFVAQDARRSGVRYSGVTNFPRVIDKLQTDFNGYRGNLWESFDFDSDQNEQNIFGFPFGPVGQFANILETNKEFQNVAEEWIWDLQNGLSAYALFNGAGIRVDEAPLAVAQDPANVGQAFLGVQGPGTIVAGTSCMGCHHKGMNPYDDILLEHTQYSVGFNNEEADFAEDTFFAEGGFELKQTLQAYVDQFVRASVVAGVSSVSLTSQSYEPIFNQARYYNDTVDICELGAEFYLDCETAKKRLIRDQQLSIELGYGVTGNGASSRKNIEARFNDIAVALNVGEQILFGVAPKCVLKANKKKVFKGDVVEFDIDVIGVAELIKINGVKVLDKLKIRLNKVGVNKITGLVANKFGANVCNAFVEVKKKGIKPTCGINAKQNWCRQDELFRYNMTYSGNPTTKTINGSAYGQSGSAYQSKCRVNWRGDFIVTGFVRNDFGQSTCIRKFEIRKKPVGHAPTCSLKGPSWKYESEPFDVKITHSNKPTSVSINGINGSSGSVGFVAGRPGKYNYTGLVRNQYGYNSCRIQVLVKPGVSCQTTIGNRSHWRTRLNLLDLATNKWIYPGVEVRDLLSGKGIKTTRDTSFRYHGWLWHGYSGGYWLVSDYDLEKCGEYEIVDHHSGGHQIFGRRK